MIGRIYRIIHTESDLCYIGSTTRELRHRWQSHKTHYQQWVSGDNNVKTTIHPYFEMYGIEKFKILLIKEYDVSDSKHLKAYEQLWMNKFKKTCVNKFNIIWTKKMYEKYRYQTSNRQAQRQPYTCSCGGTLSKKGKSRHERTKKHQNWLATKNIDV
jgi:hypothetical protein